MGLIETELSHFTLAEKIPKKQACSNKGTLGDVKFKKIKFL